MNVFFTQENTNGFSQAELDLMNEAVEIIVSKDKDYGYGYADYEEVTDSDPKYIEMLKDLVNDRFFDGCKLTDLTYTEGSRENAEAWLNGGMDDIHAGTTDEELEAIADEAESAARESDENWSMGKYGIDILTKHRDWKREMQETEEDD